MKYKEGTYYKDLGIYIGIRLTYTPHKSYVKEHIFNTTRYDTSETAILKRIKIQ